MSEYVPPLGRRFSQIYLERGSPTGDSTRLRSRIGAYFEHELNSYARGCSEQIQKRIGIDEYLGDYASDIRKYLIKSSLPDFHDAITVIWESVRLIEQQDRYHIAHDNSDCWRNFCRDAFIEQNVAYRVDEDCIVHPFVDESFAQILGAILRGLEDPRLAAVRAEVERSVDNLGGRNPDPKGAVRAIFEALEIYTKLIVTTCTVKRLNRNMITEHLMPMIQANSAPDQPAKDSVAHLANAIVDWIEAAHIYRHGQGVNEPAPPSEKLAVALVSTGMSHLRWLLDTTRLPVP